MPRILIRIVQAVFILTLLYFWVVPPTMRNDLIVYAGLGVVAICTLVLSLAYRSALRTWRGLGVLCATHIVVQAWLQWQWNLWDSAIVLVRNLNVIAGMLAWPSLVAITVSLVLLLIFRDASVIVLAIGWIGWPLWLIATALRYRTMDGLNSAPFREQIVLIVPTCLLCLLPIAGMIAFLAHWIRLAVKEVKGQKIIEESQLQS